ncbi:single-stranded-DNA-specific exonuclease RecJ [Thiotrichales bacterium 19S11-10]|nr:single-stranded-DNA-specific exonuclease RecJ [Thiotrichales bacterium 19S11-10]MCF6807957.1 single-stranded-DNA-specific exonuclease RecJ [Thiotrichales bacterium 19S9-11]MCF6811972.1 single-stranded-DNA-specific exonuclease RecJ [Thiotrichales bacterium 19S9-12]
MLKPTIKERKINSLIYQSLCQKGFPKLVSQIIASRLPENFDKAEQIAEPKLSLLDSPFLLADIEKASKRLIEALENQEVIGIETDHDCDGQTSHAVIFEALSLWFRHPRDKIRSYIGHRMQEGYGLSEGLTKRILDDSKRPSLIITADNGSTDEPRIKILKDNGIDTVVTDHHAIALDGIPKSAVAVLNPTRDDCQFPDAYIAGCMVAWLFMVSVRRKLIEKKILLENESDPRSVLDFVAVGTVADCVSMAKSINNRAVVKAGLRLIAQSKRPCWLAIRRLFPRKINAEYLGFSIGPLLNSDGRLSDAHSSVSFLLAETEAEAISWVDELNTQNQKRKSIQQTMLDQAMELAKDQVDKGKSSICIYLDDGHAGVHGIVASRLKDAFGRPVIFFSPKLYEDDVITASARSIDDIHLKNLLDRIYQVAPDMLIKYGGHKAAAGLTIYRKYLMEFEYLFEKLVVEQVSQDALGPEIYTDGIIDDDDLTLDTLKVLDQIEPFGREFDAPIFSLVGILRSNRFVGKTFQHLQLNILTETGKSIKAIWFFASRFEQATTFKQGDKLKLTFRLNEEEFNNHRSLGLVVEYCDHAEA